MGFVGYSLGATAYRHGKGGRLFACCSWMITRMMIVLGEGTGKGVSTKCGIALGRSRLGVRLHNLSHLGCDVHIANYLYGALLLSPVNIFVKNVLALRYLVQLYP